MAILFTIPVTYREGNYSTKDFDEDCADCIEFDYDAQYQILEYDVPVGDGTRPVRLYQIPEDELRETLNASYDQNGQLQKITYHDNKNEALLYIHYEDVEDAKQKIKDFAIHNADGIAELVCACAGTDVIARLFIEYFWDGEAFDFHALLGTPAQKDAVEREYPNSNTAVDNSGDYDSDLIFGDNQTLAVMLYCADRDEFDFVQYAFDLMTERVREQTVDRLNRSEDFKFISDAYD